MTERSDLTPPALRALLRDLHGSRAQERAPDGLLPGVLVELGLADGYFPYASVLGPLLIAYSGAGVTAVWRGTDPEAFVAAYEQRHGRSLRALPAAPPELDAAIARRLRGERTTLRCDLRGLSDFERATLEKATEIPRGEIRPYAWIAREIGRPGAVRAVGSALGRNPIPLLIPCHRIVRSDGQIGDYVFGTADKETILRVEGVALDALAAEARRRIRYHASDTTGIYCFPTCHHARRITAQHLVTFSSDAAAQAAGYRPCKHCRPAIAS
jgi:O-6-methylguanine DNA methyltransferase